MKHRLEKNAPPPSDANEGLVVRDDGLSTSWYASGHAEGGAGRPLLSVRHQLRPLPRRTSLGCHGRFAHLPVGHAHRTTQAVLHHGVRSLSIAGEGAFVCLFGVVFRGAASPSPPVGGPALKCLKVACRTVECGPSQSVGRLALKQG